MIFMINVFNVAHWFLHKKSLTHKQLQKLCYYAQAWHLALLDEKLFDEEIQAWVHGPVIPALYACYADYGWLPIPQEKEEYVQFSEPTIDVLNAVYNTYAQFSGEQLESLTHSELPWKEARGNLAPYEVCTNRISLETMKKYYDEKYKQAQGD